MKNYNILQKKIEIFNIKRNKISDYKMILYKNVIEISNTHYLQTLFSK